MDPREIPIQLPALRALYAQLGEVRIETCLLDFYDRMAADAMLGFFFSQHDARAVAMIQKAFLLKAMGATPSFSGKAPADGHGALPPILEGHFNRRLTLLAETLRDHGLTEEQIRTWVGFENAFRNAIVQS